MPTCTLKGCSSTSVAGDDVDDDDEELFFHRFPSREKSPTRFRAWCDRMNRGVGYEPPAHALVCSRHFNEDDRDVSDLLRIRLMPQYKMRNARLKPGTLPTLMLDVENEGKKRKRKTFTRSRRATPHAAGGYRNIKPKQSPTDEASRAAYMGAYTRPIAPAPPFEIIAAFKTLKQAQLQAANNPSEGEPVAGPSTSGDGSCVPPASVGLVKAKPKPKPKAVGGPSQGSERSAVDGSEVLQPAHPLPTANISHLAVQPTRLRLPRDKPPLPRYEDFSQLVAKINRQAVLKHASTASAPRESELRTPRDKLAATTNRQADLVYKRSPPKCRLCMGESRMPMLSIFGNQIIHKLALATKIYSVTGVSIVNGDGMPNVICQPCNKNIVNWYDFKQMCIASDVKYRSKVRRVHPPPKKKNKGWDEDESPETKVEIEEHDVFSGHFLDTPTTEDEAPPAFVTVKVEPDTMWDPEVSMCDLPPDAECKLEPPDEDPRFDAPPPTDPLSIPPAPLFSVRNLPPASGDKAASYLIAVKPVSAPSDQPPTYVLAIKPPAASGECSSAYPVDVSNVVITNVPGPINLPSPLHVGQSPSPVPINPPSAYPESPPALPIYVSNATGLPVITNAFDSINPPSASRERMLPRPHVSNVTMNVSDSIKTSSAYPEIPPALPIYVSNATGLPVIMNLSDSIKNPSAYPESPPPLPIYVSNATGLPVIMNVPVPKKPLSESPPALPINSPNMAETKVGSIHPDPPTKRVIDTLREDVAPKKPKCEADVA